MKLMITNKKRFIYGLIFILIGIMMPLIFDISNFGIKKRISIAISYYDKIYLAFAGLILVILNTLRAIPHYIGAFYISESVRLDTISKIEKIFRPITIFTLISAVYYIIGNIYPNVRYHFGIPAISLIFIINMIGRGEYIYIYDWKKTCLIIFFVASFQFLDITPALAKFPFGKGETSQEVKIVAKFLNMEQELNIISIGLFILFLLFSFLLFLLIKEENRLKVLDELKKENLILEKEAQIKDIENRTYLEMRSLVHDLKSPLTSAQALLGLVWASCNDKKMTKEIKYIDTIDKSMDNLNNMISEILSEDVSFYVRTEDLINSTLANISKNKMARRIVTTNKVPDKTVKVNKIAFTRALVNLLENAFRAIEYVDGGRIDIIVDCIKIESEEGVEISIIDNGVGIEMENMDRIWESGFTTNNSYGLGLSFVKRTVEKSGGMIIIYSKINEGTTVTIIL